MVEKCGVGMEQSLTRKIKKHFETESGWWVGLGFFGGKSPLQWTAAVRVTCIWIVFVEGGKHCLRLYAVRKWMSKTFS